MPLALFVMPRTKPIRAEVQFLLGSTSRKKLALFALPEANHNEDRRVRRDSTTARNRQRAQERIEVRPSLDDGLLS